MDGVGGTDGFTAYTELNRAGKPVVTIALPPYRRSAELQRKLDEVEAAYLRRLSLAKPVIFR